MDDDLAEEFEGQERANRPTRQDEWRDPETPVEVTDTSGYPTQDDDPNDPVAGDESG